jgi:hypothetical protein
MKLNQLAAFTIGVIVTAVSVSAVSYVNAQNDQPIRACADRKTGVMRYIDKGRCKRTERTLAWNQIGLSGAPGMQGPAGAQGSAGATGAAGAQGLAGAAGPVGGSSPTGFTARSVCGANGTTLCAVGVQGPGGGTVFFVDINNEIPEYDYLEVAPTVGGFASGTRGAWSTDTQKCGTTANLSCDIHSLDTDGSALMTLGLGAGRAATAAIVARHNAGGVAKNLYAAGVADTYTTATASDWWLPSKDELNEFCKVLKATGQQVGSTIRCVGGSREMDEPDAFWSSSEVTNDRAWGQDFDGGGQNNVEKIFNGYFVRPVRGF